MAAERLPETRSAPGAAGGPGPPPEPAGFLRRWGSIAINYPIPILAAAGLTVGAVLTWLLGQPELGHWVWLGTLLLGGIPLVYGTGRRLLRGQFAADIIAAAAIVAAILLDQPFAGVIIVLMQGGGEALEHYAFRRASSSLRGLLERAPRRAHRKVGTNVEEIAADQVRVGDDLVVRPGDIVPVDGLVLTAGALLDESPITGEAYPRRRPVGDRILSGTVSVGEPFELEALKASRDSEYARIVALVERASKEKPPIQRLADRYAVWFTPLAFALAIGAALYHQDPLTALAVLVVATPCPLLLATPIAVLGAVDRAADMGVVTKGGAALEEIAQTRAVLFDKTGTLTSGHPTLERVVIRPGGDESRLLRAAGSVEQFSAHPLAPAVVARAREATVELAPLTVPREYPGAGIAGTVDGERILVGSRSLCASEGVRDLGAVGELVQATGDLRGRLISFVAIEGRAVGALVFSDPVRPQAVGLVRRLERLGVEYVGLLTGDRAENAVALGERLGIPHVRAELLPEQKVAEVGAVRRARGSTVMVGDGVNDAAALAAASVGVAMGGHGAGVSAEAADIVLLNDDVSRVADGIALGQRMLRIARQGAILGLGASIVLMLVATTGIIPPAFGAVIQEVLDIATILNALRVVLPGASEEGTELRRQSPGGAAPAAA